MMLVLNGLLDIFCQIETRADKLLTAKLNFRWKLILPSSTEE